MTIGSKPRVMRWRFLPFVEDLHRHRLPSDRPREGGRSSGPRIVVEVVDVPPSLHLAEARGLDTLHGINQLCLEVGEHRDLMAVP